MWPEPQPASLSFSLFFLRRATEDTWEVTDAQRDRSPATLSISLGQCKSWEGLPCLLTTLTGKTGRQEVSPSSRLPLGIQQLQSSSGYPQPQAGSVCPLSCRLALEIGPWDAYYKVTVATFETTGQKSLF